MEARVKTGIVLSMAAAGTAVYSTYARGSYTALGMYAVVLLALACTGRRGGGPSPFAAALVPVAIGAGADYGSAGFPVAVACAVVYAVAAGLAHGRVRNAALGTVVLSLALSLAGWALFNPENVTDYFGSKHPWPQVAVLLVLLAVVVYQHIGRKKVAVEPEDYPLV
jgi:hypothetical protein